MGTPDLNQYSKEHLRQALRWAAALTELRCYLALQCMPGEQLVARLESVRQAFYECRKTRRIVAVALNEDGTMDLSTKRVAPYPAGVDEVHEPELILALEKFVRDPIRSHMSAAETAALAWRH